MSYFEDILSAGQLDLPWEKLSGCNILVTGASGLIGSCIVEILMSRISKDYHVYASGRKEKQILMRFKNYINDPSFHFLKYDVMSQMEGHLSFQYIIHAASNASPNYFVNNPVEVIKSNILGVCNLMDYGLNHDLKRFLYISSGEVYGEGDGRIFDENYSGYVNPMLPRSCYPSSKRAAETLCVAYGAEYSIETLIARPCHIYGPHFTESDNRVYAQFIRNVLEGSDIVMKSTGTQFRSWCYVVDCATALLYIVLKGKNGEAYNIADNSSNISIRNLAEMIAEISGKKVVIDCPSEKEKTGYNVVTQSVFSTEKLHSLGWRISGCMKDKMIATIEESNKRL